MLLAPPAAEETPSTAPPTAAALRELVREHRDRFQPILGLLRDQPWRELVTTRDLLDGLAAQGLDWPERTLRLYLAEMDAAGLIARQGRRGFSLTPAGAAVARELTIARRLGAILYRMDETACQVDQGRGLVSINAYVLPRELLMELCDEIEAVFRAGLAVGGRLLLVGAGGDILGRAVPPGHVGVGTICSLSIAGLLLRRGIPTQPVFGGLLQIENRQPAHFLEMIRYDGTTLSPNEAFIRANLTSVSRAAATGTGAITASFREAPLSALPGVRAAADACHRAGFPGILHIGRPGQAVFNIPVHEGRVGIVLATGLNPLASLWEHHRLRSGAAGEELRGDASRPMVGPARYEDLIPWQEFRRRAVLLPADDARRASA
jgi:HTH-type transcriptional regulator, global nitrogen regulator NrpRI